MLLKWWLLMLPFHEDASDGYSAIFIEPFREEHYLGRGEPYKKLVTEKVLSNT